MTRLFNDPAAFADEALEGFTAAHRRWVRPVGGGVVRATATPAGQVAVVIGGGSGHYPAFSGLVGRGPGARCGRRERLRLPVRPADPLRGHRRARGRGSPADVRQLRR
ncbi:hypothetical protein RKD48_000423 [Streptomyces ambofaciens]